MDTLEVLSVIPQEGNLQENSAETAQERSPEQHAASPLAVSRETRELAYELRRKTERQTSLGSYTVETSRVDQDLDPDIYLAFLQNVSQQFKHTATRRSTQDNVAHAVEQIASEDEVGHAHGAMHDSGQPQDGMSRHFYESSKSHSGSSTLPEYVALLRHKPRSKTEASGPLSHTEAKESTKYRSNDGDHDDDKNGGGASEENPAPRSSTEKTVKKASKWTWRGAIFFLLTILLTVGLPAAMLLQTECRDPVMKTISFAWREIAPFFKTISPRDLFLHDELLLYDALNIPEIMYYEQPTPDETDKHARIKARFAAQAHAADEIDQPLPDLEPGSVAVEAELAQPDDEIRHDDANVGQDIALGHELGVAEATETNPLDEPVVVVPSVNEAVEDMTAYQDVAARPDAVAATSPLLARVRRLESLVDRDIDLVTSYHDMHSSRHPVADVLQNFGLKLLMARRFFPATDPECRWNFLSERCEPPCTCSWQYKIGDLWPSRSCRKRQAGATCDEDGEHEGPIRRTFTTMGDRTKVILRKVNSWIPRMPRPILRANKQRAI